MADKTATQLMLERRDLERSLGIPPADIKTQEDYCRWALGQIDKRAKELAKPFIDMLVEIERTRPVKPIVIPLANLSKEDIKRLGLPPE
jgi:hypothetical protein